MARSKMVITGGRGFIGSHLVDRFRDRYRIVVVDNLTRDARAGGSEGAGDAEVVIGDVRDQALLERSFAGAEVVIHLAAIAGVSNYDRKPVDVLRVNLLGTVAVIDAVIAARVPWLIDVSTSEVYGPEATEASELSSPLVSGPVAERRWTYAVSKLAGEHFVLRHGEANGFAATCLRPFNVYGPRQVGEGAISNFARALARNEPLTVEGDGADLRAWCYVDDFVAAVSLVLEKDAGGQVFNIGTPEAACTTRELADHMIRIAGKGSIRNAPAPRTGIRRRIPNIDHAARMLGYRPTVSLETGLRRTIDWFRNAEAAAV